MSFNRSEEDGVARKRASEEDASSTYDIQLYTTDRTNREVQEKLFGSRNTRSSSLKRKRWPGDSDIKVRGKIDSVTQKLIRDQIVENTLCKPPDFPRHPDTCKPLDNNTINPDYVFLEDAEDESRKRNIPASNYKKGSLVTNDLVLLARRHSDDSILGFATLKVRDDASIYIDVLCSGNKKIRNVASKLMLAITDIGKILGTETVRLRALDYVWGQRTKAECQRTEKNDRKGLISYYKRKFGFEEEDRFVHGAPMEVSIDTLLSHLQV